MTASLIEAFHIAAVRFVQWQRNNDEIDEGFVIWEGVGPKEFLPEPTVTFFGQEYKISVICERAKILQGRMATPMQILFDSFICRGFDPEVNCWTYTEAVELLEGLISSELERERDDLTLRDRIVQNARKELIESIEAEYAQRSQEGRR